jgi:hypothetical protein
MIGEVLKNRIETALSSDNLMNLFEQLEREGLNKNELENIFTVFLKSAQEENIPESDEEKLFDLLDRITGYCHPGRCLFPPEKYQAHRGVIRFFAANEDQKSIVRFIFENTSFRLFRDFSYENGKLEINSVKDFDSANHSKFYLWNKTISNEFSIHEHYFEHIPKTCWSFLSDPTFILSFGNLEENTLEPSFITHAFRTYPTKAAFDSIEPIRVYIDEIQVATAIGVPVLQDAFSLNEQGIHFKESPKTRWEYKLDLDSL